MKESTQTLLFLAAALASVVVATQVQPTDATYEVRAEIGKTLFRSFETEAAKSMRIVRFNEETATLREFEVAEENGVWSIPSKGGYPADAQRQMAEATTGVIDLEILSIATQSAEDHEKYGVVEPSSSLEVGATGVGARVTLSDDSGEALVDVVVGKPVKDSDDQHYVRRTSQDAVFTVAIDPEKFSTKFEDWIEDDLLDLSTFDITRVLIRDYSAELVMRGFRPAIAFDPRGDYSLEFDDDENKWDPTRLRTYNKDAQAYEEFELEADESVNEDTLRELKNAVGDLKIVDVERKPSGLSADLQAGDDFFGDNSAVESLMVRGFAPTEDGEVLSSEGEVLVTTKTGVEYVLRFGKLQLSSEEEQTDAGDDDAEDASGVNRYLFVMARVNEEFVEPPELEELPEIDLDPADAEDAEQEDPEGETDSAETGEDEQPSADSEGETREEIEKRNQRAQDEYDARVEAAQQRVDELNARFGDWYYVISDGVYKKIAVGRDELFQVEQPEDESEANESAPAAPGIPGLPDIPGVSFDPTAPADRAEIEGEDEMTADAAAAEEPAPNTSEQGPAVDESAPADAPKAPAADPAQVEPVED